VKEAGEAGEETIMQEDQFKPNTIGAFRIGELELPRS
jgi:hypothetical protein